MTTNNSINNRTISISNASVDPKFVVSSITPNQTWGFGEDTSALSFNIAPTGVFGTGLDVLISDNLGRVRFPRTPAFAAFANATATNVTGNGTVAVVFFQGVILDQGGDYDSVSIFTSPIAGKYRFSASVMVLPMTPAHTFQIVNLSTSNRSWQGSRLSQGSNPNSEIVLHVAALVDMDAGDTALIDFMVAGSTQTVGYFGGASAFTLFTHFSGELAC